MPIYQIYLAKDDSEISTFPALNDYEPHTYHLLTHTVDDEPMELVATFYAPRWSSAVKVSNDIIFSVKGPRR